MAAGLDDGRRRPIDALEGLGSLLDKSLISEPAGSDRDGTPRVAMLKTIKGYAAERLDAQPEFAAAAREAHARYYVQLAVDSSAAADDDPGGRASADRLAGEIDNLRIAWRHSVDHRDLSRLWALRDPMWAFYDGRGWYAATIELINDLLGVVEATPDNPDRWQMEVKLRTTLARAMTLESGYSDQAEDAYRAAYTIIKEHGDVPQFFPVLRNLGSFHGFRGEFPKAIHYANEILRLAETEDDPSMRVAGLAMLGPNTGFSGHLEEGLGYLDEALRTFEARDFRPRQHRFGIDPRVSTLTTAAFFLWLQGYPDRAVMRADRAVSLATEIDHPYSLAFAFYHSGFLHLWRREAGVVRDRAEAALDVATTTGLPVWQALATCLRGAATSALGEPDEGLRQMADGIDQYHGLRTPPVFWPMIRFMQAGAHVDALAPEAGIPLIDDGLAIAGDDGVLGPLLQIVRGDLSLLEPHPEPAAATASFQRAWSGAAGVGARMPQLRAAIRLCQCATEAERADRLEALRSVHATFTEGQSTPDLREAPSSWPDGWFGALAGPPRLLDSPAIRSRRRRLVDKGAMMERSPQLGGVLRVVDPPRTDRASAVVRSRRVEVIVTTGTIKKVVSDRGFGFIAAEDGKEYFFHRDGLDVVPGLRSSLRRGEGRVRDRAEPEGRAREERRQRLTGLGSRPQPLRAASSIPAKGA